MHTAPRLEVSLLAIRTVAPAFGVGSATWFMSLECCDASRIGIKQQATCPKVQKVVQPCQLHRNHQRDAESVVNRETLREHGGLLDATRASSLSGSGYAWKSVWR